MFRLQISVEPKMIIYKFSQKIGDFLFGEIEVDESYFGGHQKGKRVRGAEGKIPIFGFLYPEFT